MALSSFRATALVLLAALTAAPVLADDDPVVSNLELMTRLTSEAARELIASVPDNINMGNVILVSDGTGEEYAFVENVIAKVLTSDGHRVYEAGTRPATSPGDSLRDPTLQFEYQAVNFDLIYTKIYRPFLIGGKKVKRSGDVRLLVKLIDPADRSVVWIGEATKSANDKFSYSRLAEVEASTYAFTKPEQTSSSWGKIVEPVVVSGIIIGLIYLFFSNQDSN